MSNKTLITVTTIFGIMIGLLILFCFKFYNDQQIFKNIMINDMRENRKSLTNIYSSMSIDEQRLVKIKQVEKIIKYANTELSKEMINTMSMFIVNEIGKYPNLSNPFLVCSWINQESKFDKNIKSSVGALGLTQLMPETASDICQFLHWNYYPNIEFDMEKNIIMGMFYLNKMIDLDGSLELGLTAYNGGFKMKNRLRLLRKYENGDSLNSDDKLEITYLTEESKNYAKSIFEKETEFRELVLTP